MALTVELHPAIEHLAQPGHFEPEWDGRRRAVRAPRWSARRRRTGPAIRRPRWRSWPPRRRRSRGSSSATGARDGNPLLPALALAAFYLGEARRVDLLGLREAASGRVVVGVVEPELADHEPMMAEGGRLLRTWFPVEGAPRACVQVRFARP